MLVFWESVSLFDWRARSYSNLDSREFLFFALLHLSPPLFRDRLLIIIDEIHLPFKQYIDQFVLGTN